ncbi:Hint domain-containing protein [Roseovarius salinarum]|uniref:Hint domain-containing protein n=1 Tax=Roseovarius salinarum TaxID=1981892 RepID=UPI0012FFDDAC|nr:Hint domain-containing protein [Roseovarius salinarum]
MLFESAFSAFARGTLIETPEGPVAVEDLHPGALLNTREGTPAKLLWVGSMTLAPSASEHGPGPVGLTRVTAGAFGLARPMCDLMAGPGARILRRPAGLNPRGGAEMVLTPPGDLVDGLNVVAVAPPGPLTLYHLCLRRHAVIHAAGLEVESFHPGRGFENGMSPRLLSQFLSMFAHAEQPADFGPTAHPRLPLRMPDAA